MVAQKQGILTAAANQLKAEFIGLDEIIDRIMGLVTPWYLYPELQQRPTVINLWGLTGVGKTSLVKRLVELLQFGPKFYHFDMGTNSERVDTLKTFFKELCRWGSGFPFVLALDEFQYASTKSRLGEEVDKTYSRAVWELLDTGRFQAFRSGFGGRQDLGAVITELKYLLKRGVTVENGLVTGNVAWYLKVTATASDWRDMFDGDVEVEGTDVEIRRKGKIPLRKLRFVKEDVVGEIFESCDDLFEHRIEVRDKLLSLNGEETIAFLEEMALHAQSRRELDCTKALVFVMGNLDEAFGFAGVMNPDIDADEFHRLTKRITVPHIKTALQSRFRNEQIARLGNNHPSDFFKYSFGITQVHNEEPETVILSFTPYQAQYILSHPLHHSQDTVLENDEEVQVALTVYLTHELYMAILGWGNQVKVVAPEKLRNRIRQMAEELIEQYTPAS